MSQAVAVALDPRSLQLIILPTEKCNFRCTYCYETFEVGRMKRATIDGIKRLVEARVSQGTLRSLSLSWFGGEPLLAREVMLEIAAAGLAMHAAGRLEAFSGEVTTNAYLLTPAVLAELVALRQTTYQISLDGYGAGHDETRRYASGKGTFEVIWRNLLAARDTSLSFQITLRCHLTRANEASMAELVDHIGREFRGDARFNVFFKPIENLGGPNSKAITTLDKLLARERVDRLQECLEDAGLHVSAVIDGPESSTGAPIIAPLVRKPATPTPLAAPPADPTGLASFAGYICYAAKPNSLMVRADGSIGKCTVLLDDPRNRVGRLNEDGTVTLDADLINQVWMRGFASNNARELGCPAQNLPRLTPPSAPVASASAA
ncbi:MAG TPA: radical SAM protein [Verrucomicrobiae bacterium]|nr:radical SAM protein [Verrucomicrobiae bacterium]